jgi:hypothetical protein
MKKVSGQLHDASPVEKVPPAPIGGEAGMGLRLGLEVVE